MGMDAEAGSGLVQFLGWCTVINMGFLVLAAVAMVSMRDWMMKVHCAMFGLTREDAGRAYFQYLAQYKIAIIVLNLLPYVALKLMG